MLKLDTIRKTKKNAEAGHHTKKNIYKIEFGHYMKELDTI